LKISKINLQLILLFFVGLLNVVFTQIPLFNLIGYEFSVVNSILFFSLSGFIAVHNEKSIDQKPNYFQQHFTKAKFFFLFAIVIPLFIGITSTIVSSECPLNDGLLFYAIISIPSLFFGYVSGLTVSIFFRKFKKTIFTALFFVILFYPIIEIYFFPQIYFYNLIVGFFPGTIYDEDLSVNMALVLYRLSNLVIIILIFWLAILMKQSKIKKWIAAIFILFIIFLFAYSKPSLNFATDFSSIQAELNKKIISENFELFIPSEIDSSEVDYIILLHEYYLEQIEKFFDVKLKEKIQSFLFKNEEQKRRLFGAGSANVAKPWLNQIYLNYRDYEETIKHELTHVVAKNFGTTIFKVAHNINPALIEGLAMAVEDNFDDLSIHQAAKLALIFGYKVSLANLFSGLNFFSQFSSVGYIYSGSFIKYIAETHGSETVKKIYSNGNIQEITGNSIDDIESDYLKYLEVLPIQFNKNRAQLYFGGQTIFQKYCARTAAHRTKEAWSYYNLQDYIKAKEKFLDVYNYSGSYQALFGFLNSQIKLNQFSIAQKFLEKEINKFRESRYFYNLELQLGDLYALNNNETKGFEVYDSLLIQSPHYNYNNEIIVRKYVSKKGIDSLNAFLKGDRKKKFNMLVELNKKELIYESIPVLIRLTNDWNELKSLLSMFKNRMKVSNENSYLAIIELSKVAIKINEYELAKYFAAKSLEYNNEDSYSHLRIENLKMANWFNNFAEEVKKNIKHDE
jgi:hypothetical protein